ncbi:MAG TPA: metallopeptidase TldD-related protein [Acidimicrobiia bacterium]|nr:metallopeptidase TldD-related protein [Acidimicrobiia bacterium]
MKNAEQIASRVIELVGDRAEAEAVATVGTAALTRFANSFIHQNVAEDTAGVRVRVAVDRKVAALTGNRVDDEALTRLVDDVIEAAKLQPVDEDWPGIAPPAAVPTVDHADASTRDATPAQRAETVRAFIDAGDGLSAAGFCDTDFESVAFANTLGQRASGQVTRATIDGIHQTGESAGSAHQTSVRFADLDGTAAGELAADRARRGMKAFDLKPGEYEVVLAPECVATMAIFMGFYGFNAKAYQEGGSFVEIGASQFDPRIAITDDPMSPDALGLAFDAEGTPKRTLDLVRAGVTKALVHDRRTALKEGTESTGHAFADASVGPITAGLVIGSGADGVQDMIASVDRGLYVATFNYCRILDPKSQVVTGLTRNGTFMIENGRITGGVTNMRFTQSFVQALGPGRVLGVGDDLRYADSEFGAGVVRAPSLHLAGWNFTGGAEG